MTGRTLLLMVLAAGAAVAVACADAQPADAQEIVCRPTAPLENRASPYDSTLVTVGGETAKICYGRPSLKGRQAIGGELVPYGRLWRTGANEPTIIHVPFAASIAGIQVQPGSYSIYTVPGEAEWTVIVNASTSQWGHESRYTPEVQAREVGRATVPAQALDAPIETFTIRSQPRGDTTDVILEWDRARVALPITRGS